MSLSNLKKNFFQGGENQLRVVNEDGEPLDITVQQDGQLLLTGDASGMVPGSQYVIQYYNPEEVVSFNKFCYSIIFLLIPV